MKLTGASAQNYFFQFSPPEVNSLKHRFRWKLHEMSTYAHKYDCGNPHPFGHGFNSLKTFLLETA